VVIRVIALLAAVTTSIAGCGAETPAAAPTTTTPTMTTDSAPQATVADFASVVAEHHADWDEAVADLESRCGDPTTIAACRVSYSIVGLKAQTIHLALTGRHKPSAPVYVGVPPAAIKSLLSQTESAADTVGTATDALRDAPGCLDPLATSCLTESFAADRAIDHLSGKLDAWSAY